MVKVNNLKNKILLKSCIWEGKKIKVDMDFGLSPFLFILPPVKSYSRPIAHF